MMTGVHAHSMSWKRIGSLTSRFVLVAVACVLAYLVFRTVQAYATGVLPAPALGWGVWELALAGVVYMLGHGFRILRLALLVGGWRVGFREIASFHLMSAAFTLATPLKLGEVFRVTELSRIAGGLVRSITAVWLERAFDACIILAVILLAMASAPELGDFGPIAALSAAFVAITAVVLLVAPDNLRRLSVLIIRRYKSPSTVAVLHTLDTARRSILEAPGLVRYKFGSLLTLSALIWTCEIGSFMLAAPGMFNAIHDSEIALINFLSSVTRGETLLGVIEAGQSAFFGRVILPYLAVTQGVLAIAGGAAAIFYLRRRLRK